jgi:hypothetical protein
MIVGCDGDIFFEKKEPRPARMLSGILSLRSYPFSWVFSHLG